MKLPLSNRLLACCQFVRPGDRVADIGCDHGYLGIHLLRQGIAGAVIAADVHEMPLNSACRNAVKYGVADQMRFFLSDGLGNIPRDFDVAVCAGMGADTIISILEAAPWLQGSSRRLILQCQSKRPQLRAYLHSHGFTISREILAQDGKFIYPVMEVLCRPASDPWRNLSVPGSAGQRLSPAPGLSASGDPGSGADPGRAAPGRGRNIPGVGGASGTAVSVEGYHMTTVADVLTYVETHAPR